MNNQSYQDWAWLNMPEPGEDDDAYVARMLRVNEPEAREAAAWVRRRMAERESAQQNNIMAYLVNPDGEYINLIRKDLDAFLKARGWRYDKFIAWVNGQAGEKFHDWTMQPGKSNYRKPPMTARERTEAAARQGVYAPATEQSVVGPFGDPDLLRPTPPLGPTPKPAPVPHTWHASDK